MSKCIACKGEDEQVTFVVVFSAASLEAVPTPNPEAQNPIIKLIYARIFKYY